MKQLALILLDWLGVAQTADVDEQHADIAIALAVMRSDIEDLRARIDEYDLSLSPGAQA